MAYYLGIDAGGTKTECVLAQDEIVLARAIAGTIKTLLAPPEKAERNLDILLRAVTTQSKISLKSISRTCVGLAGISVPHVAEWTRHALHARVGGEILLAGDEEVALDAAFHGGAGVLVVAGTGSNIIGRAASGKLVHVGGWGPVLADEGSGMWIGRQAVRAVFNALDHGETTLLLEKVLQHWSLSDIQALIDLCNQQPGPDFSMLTPLVAECATQGDSYASRVLKRAGMYLGKYAILATQQIHKADRSDVPYPQIAFTGSILRHVIPVREEMFATILRELHDAQIVPDAVDAVLGALWRARRQ